MRRIVLSLVMFFSLGQPGGAQRSPEHDTQTSACLAWQGRLASTVRQYRDLKILPADDATVVNGLVEIMGKRCVSDDPQRISQLYVILIDVLSDQRHQP